MNGARLVQLAALAGATALLAASAWLMHGRWQAWRIERVGAAQAQQRWHSAQALLPELKRREDMARQVDALSTQVADQGFDRTRWGERRVRRALSQGSRVEVARVIDALAPRGAASVLVADSFELATVTPGAGLFHTPQPGDEGLSLGIAATQYFQLKSVQP